MKSRKMVQAALLAAITLGGLVVGASPAAAHSGYDCTYMTTGGVGVLTSGAIRQLGGGHSHKIGWSFTGRNGCDAFFPSGGSLNVRVRFLQRSPSGGCTSTAIRDSELTVFRSEQTVTLTGSEPSGTCYRLIWRPNNAAAANRTLPGTLFWT